MNIVRKKRRQRQQNNKEMIYFFFWFEVEKMIVVINMTFNIYQNEALIRTYQNYTQDNKNELNEQIMEVIDNDDDNNNNKLNICTI